MKAGTLGRAKFVNRASGFMFILLAVAGCRSTTPPPGHAPKLARFFIEAADNRSTTVALPQSGVRVAVNAQPVLTEGDIVDVAVAEVELGKCLMFQIAPGATRDLYRLTASHQGRRLVLVIDGAALGARRIDGPITDGVLFIFVEVPDDALPGLVAELKKSTKVIQRERARKG